MLSSSAEQSSSSAALIDSDVFAECWKRGELGYKILAYQEPVYTDIKLQLWGSGGYRSPNGPQRKHVPEIHRKFGKSTVCGIIACELCRQKPGARVFWGAETQRQVGLFLHPIMLSIIADCPAHLRPRWYRQDGMWVFPETGSHIVVGGCEDEAKCDRMRGPECDLFIIDEAGQIALLHYLYTSVVLWMVSRTGGRVIMPSTPATTPGHPFTAFCVLAEAGDGGYQKRTVEDSCFTEAQLDELAKECGGRDTPQWRREAMVERVVDALRAIVGDFTTHADAIVRPQCMRCGMHFDTHVDELCATGQRFLWYHEAAFDDDGEITHEGPPEYRDCYVAADPGWHPDLFALLFGYWAFRAARLVIEDELEFTQPTTLDVARGVMDVEERRWGAYFAKLRREQRPDDARPYARISDTAPQIICDLTRLHDLEFSGTRKDDKEAQVNEVRLFCSQGKLAVHPRCKKLIAHCKAGIWNKKRSSYERIPGFGHFDFIDALVYLVRNVDRTHNPYPAVPWGVRPDTHWIRPGQPEPIPDHLQGWAEAFGIR